jgi:hypothetical protein
MATIGANFILDYDGALSTGFVGTIATGASTGVIQLGQYRVFRIYINRQTAPSNSNERFTIRFTLGNSKTGHTAPTPTSASPFFTADEDFQYELGASYDQINLANLATDNTAITLGYSIVPLSKF